ncbi:MAG: 2-C-methyl-D-erythritol 2,4-cyclodiphosphate synthase [Clostridia bacterium]|nr:2-C-methyl-D-erythritol 2,4-cyclodiphosphate synthase [Clostridia bacterium]
MKVSAIILAAGSGSRMGTDKMLYSLLGKSVIIHTIEKFLRCERVDEIIVVASENNINIIKEEIKNNSISNCKVITGGKERGESSYKGIKEAMGEYVLIHDGARPLITPEVINSVVDGALKYGASAPGCTPKDTVKKTADGFVNETFKRSELVNIQTPQGFKKTAIIKAYEKIGFNETDDCAVIEKAGERVYVCEGSYENIKITTPMDIVVAENIIKKERGACMRIGTGFDTHKLTEGRKLIIGGVEIPFEKGLLGHSDADVLVHAIIDALLGAAALGDIGSHFPDTDEAYKGISSIELLERTAKLLLENGYTVSNIDSTIIVQKPKMAPHIDAMRENIAKALGIDVNFVSVKAKTNEHMGFTGRGEGIEARAVALLNA